MPATSNVSSPENRGGASTRQVEEAPAATADRGAARLNAGRRSSEPDVFDSDPAPKITQVFANVADEILRRVNTKDLSSLACVDAGIAKRPNHASTLFGGEGARYHRENACRQLVSGLKSDSAQSRAKAGRQPSYFQTVQKALEMVVNGFSVNGRHFAFSSEQKARILSSVDIGRIPPLSAHENTLAKQDGTRARRREVIEQILEITRQNFADGASLGKHGEDVLSNLCSGVQSVAPDGDRDILMRIRSLMKEHTDFGLKSLSALADAAIHLASEDDFTEVSRLVLLQDSDQLSEADRASLLSEQVPAFLSDRDVETAGDRALAFDDVRALTTKVNAMQSDDSWKLAFQPVMSGVLALLRERALPADVYGEQLRDISNLPRERQTDAYMTIADSLSDDLAADETYQRFGASLLNQHSLLSHPDRNRVLHTMLRSADMLNPHNARALFSKVVAAASPSAGDVPDRATARLQDALIDSLPMLHNQEPAAFEHPLGEIVTHIRRNPAVRQQQLNTHLRQVLQTNPAMAAFTEIAFWH